MSRDPVAFQRAMKLAAVSGLKCSMGPAILSASENLPERKYLAAMAVGEMIVDKMPFVPSRSALPLLIPRAFAGYWVTKRTMEREGIDDPGAAAMGAAVAAGVATFAPLLRGALRRILGVPDFALGLAEDYVALRVGGDAVGLSIEEMKDSAIESIQEVGREVGPAFEDAKGRLSHVGGA